MQVSSVVQYLFGKVQLPLLNLLSEEKDSVMSLQN